jgi:hypothetical protein
MYLNVWQPRLQHGAGAAAFFTGHRGHAYASTALMDPMTKAFVADIHHFIASAGVELVHFGKERKDDVTQRYLAGFTGTEGVLYVGRAQEKATVWRTQRQARLPVPPRLHQRDPPRTGTAPEHLRSGGRDRAAPGPRSASCSPALPGPPPAGTAA